jgi:hypothetical protein
MNNLEQDWEFIESIRRDQLKEDQIVNQEWEKVRQRELNKNHSLAPKPPWEKGNWITPEQAVKEANNTKKLRIDGHIVHEKEEFLKDPDLYKERHHHVAELLEQHKLEAQQVKQQETQVTLQPMHPDDYRALQEKRAAVQQQETREAAKAEITQPTPRIIDEVKQDRAKAIAAELERIRNAQGKAQEQGHDLGLGHKL